MAYTMTLLFDRRIQIVEIAEVFNHRCSVLYVEGHSRRRPAPAAGAYTYLCTVPGHYTAGMKGTLTVQ
jgi:plastocyanin